MTLHGTAQTAETAPMELAHRPFILSRTPAPFPSDPGRFPSSEAVDLGQADPTDPACPLFRGPAAAGKALVLEGVSHVGLKGEGLSHRFCAGKLHVLHSAATGDAAALLAILSLTVRPASGHVRWGRLNLSALKPAQQAAWRRESLGLVSESGRLVAVMTVRDHVRLAASVRGRVEAEAEGLAMLGALGMGALFNALPDQLSGSEKQRLAIAQALSARPAVLLANQPTAALDETSAAQVATTLRTFAQDRNAVVICASRDPVVTSLADTVLAMEPD